MCNVVFLLLTEIEVEVGEVCASLFAACTINIVGNLEVAERKYVDAIRQGQILDYFSWYF